MKKLILILILLMVGQVGATGDGSSTESKLRAPSVTVNTARDSALWVFGFPETNYYDSLWSYPIADTPGTILEIPSSAFDLDSIGEHSVLIFTYISGAIAETIDGQWNHKAATPDVNIASADNGVFDSLTFEDSSHTANKFHTDFYAKWVQNGEVVIRDTTDTGKTIAVKEDSLIYQGSASSLDSTLISNLLHRIVWGTAVGSGSDSSTIAQRDVSPDFDNIIGTLDAAEIGAAAFAVAKFAQDWFDSVIIAIDARAAIGDTNKEPLYNIWHGEIMTEARALHHLHLGVEKLEPCQHCYLPRKTEPAIEFFGKQKIIVENFFKNCSYLC